MPRPKPTPSASLLDFAGQRAAQRLQQTSDVIAERRKKKWAAYDKAAYAASARGEHEALFASRINRGGLRDAPRRVPLGPRATNQWHAGTDGASAPLAISAHGLQLRPGLGSIAPEGGTSGALKLELSAAQKEQLARTFAGYTVGSDEDPDGLVHSAMAEWMSGMRACPICVKGITQQDRIWSCSMCASSTHLTCIQTWASKLISFVDDQNTRGAEPWGCPSCRHMFKRREYPSDYLCFCGKERDPVPSPWTLPHSCGEHCEKKFACGHTCKLLCHPGRCPPCPLAVLVACYCGKAKKTRRCGNPAFSCAAPCGKRLGCGVHFCPRECHSGDCGRCETKLVATCRCGKKKKLLPCADAADFRCESVCGNLKPCGVHKCEEVCCAPDECPPCPTEWTCSCARTTIRFTCRSAKSTRLRCEHTCSRWLECGKHKCLKRCHEGPCDDCTQASWQTCRCGAVTKETRCSRDFLCDKKCNRDRGCRNHKCGRRCCDGRCPPCTNPCGRRLDCGICKCDMVCGHSGYDSLGVALYNCPPCTKLNEVRCFCGASLIMIPCGLPKKPPPCLEACRVPPVCRHTARSPHVCHAGSCPPCTQECGALLPECGHSCSQPCHDPVMQLDTTLAAWSRRRDQSLDDALAALMPARPSGTELSECPPCATPVQRACLGLHTHVEKLCHERDWFSCSSPCGNWLPCGNHHCESECHQVLLRRSLADFEELLESGSSEGEGGRPGPCEAIVEGSELPPPPTPPPEYVLARKGGKAGGARQRTPPPAPRECGECELDCMRPRPEGCKHACPWPCHFEPCPPCYADVFVRCYCGQSRLTYACSELASWPQFGDEVVDNPFLRCGLACFKSYEKCPHWCEASCHFGPCPPCRKQDVKVRCKCGRMRREVPCVEAFVDGKQQVLECEQACKEAIEAAAKAEKEAAAAAAQAAADAAAKAEEEAKRQADWAAGARERKVARKEQREKEAEERRQREEQKRLRKLRLQKLRCCGIVLAVLLCAALFICTLVVLRMNALDAA